MGGQSHKLLWLGGGHLTPTPGRTRLGAFPHLLGKSQILEPALIRCPPGETEVAGLCPQPHPNSPCPGTGIATPSQTKSCESQRPRESISTSTGHAAGDQDSGWSPRGRGGKARSPPSRSPPTPCRVKHSRDLSTGSTLETPRGGLASGCKTSHWGRGGGLTGQAEGA